MYGCYKIWVAKNYPTQSTITSKRQYRHTFNNNFNLHFYKPKKNQCNLCFAWAHATSEEETKTQENHNKHIKDKNSVQEHERRRQKRCPER